MPAAAPPARRPTGLRPATSTDADTGTIAVDPAGDRLRVIAAVTGGVPDDVADVLIPGCFTRSLKARTPKVCLSHDWAKPIGRVVQIAEYLPGDPRLPATTGSNRPWPRESGALIATAQINTAVREGKDTLAMARFFGAESCWSIGYKVNKAKQRDGVREIYDLDLYEISPVLWGAHRDARLIPDQVKAARPGLEVKSAVSVANRRLIQPATCAICGDPWAAGLTAPLPYAVALVCRSCVEAVDKLAEDAGYISAADLATAQALDAEEEPTSEEAFMAALDGERSFTMGPDGVLIPDDAPGGSEAQGRAWSPAGRRSVERELF